MGFINLLRINFIYIIYFLQTALHTGVGSQPQFIEPRMAQLENLEAKVRQIDE